MISPPARGAYLNLSDILRISFPAGDEGNAPRGTEFAVHVIPQGNEPRWVVIGDPRNAAPVFRSWRPFKISTRVRWSAVVAASAHGLLARLPGVISTRSVVDLSYWRRLPGFDDDWVPVVHIGNPSYTRKITVFFVDRQEQKCKAVAKVPLSGASAQAILNEADVLDRLRGAEYLPACLFRDRQRGIAAQAWLEGAPLSRAFRPSHMELLARFAVPEGMVRVSDQRKAIAGELEESGLPFDRDVISRAQGFLDYDAPLPAFIEHRDFAPWNLKRLENGQTGAIDWEWTVLRGLPCQDIYRYFYIQDALFNGPGNAWQVINSQSLVRDFYRRFELPPEALPALAMHYLLRVMAMDWRGGNVFLAKYGYGQIEALLAAQKSRVMRR